MKYICITNIDSDTGVLCTQEPMRTGPVFPMVKGLQLNWANESTWPVRCNPDGTYQSAPKHYGTCDDDANTDVLGVLEVLTEAEWLQRKEVELLARKPFASWVLIDDRWVPPVQMPTDGKLYDWDEPTTSWIEVPQA